MDDRINYIVELYELFYRDFTGNSKFKFVYSKQNLSLINSFISKLDHKYGTDWLFDYFGFQFQLRSTQDINPNFMFGKVKIMLSWVIGSKAFNYYLQASDEQKFYGRDYVRKRGIKNHFKEDTYFRFDSIDLKSYHDRERRRFLNTDLGFIHCNDLKLSFDNKSKYCLICKNKKLCIRLGAE